MEPLIVEMPYPSLSGVDKNLKYAHILEHAYAGRHGELTAILQYIYQSVYFEQEDKREISDTLLRIAIAEMKHLKILATLILELGGDPKYVTQGIFGNVFYDASAVSYSKTPEKMLLDDLADELIAIDFYRSSAEEIQDEKVSAILKRITLDEELHVLVLKEKIASL